jgi:hypothetical protein
MWRDSFMGEWCDREAFVKGREQTVEYAKILKDTMANGPDDVVRLVEDRGHLDRGRVILKVERKERELRDNVSAKSLSQGSVADHFAGDTCLLSSRREASPVV